MSIQLSIAAHVRAAALALLMVGSAYTPAIGLVAVPFVLWELRRFRVLPFVLPLFAVFALAGWLHPHQRDTFENLMTWTLLSALAGCLLRDDLHVLAFARIWLAAGGALALVSFWYADPSAVWVIGSALVAVVWLAAGRHVWWELVLAAGSLMSVSLLVSGGRRALAAAVVGAALMLAARTTRRGVWIGVAAVAAVLLVVWTPRLPRATWSVLAGHPAGIGWGNWGVRRDLWLEIAIEAGWAPAAIVLAAVGWVLFRLWRTAGGEPAAALVLGLLIGEIATVTVTGNVNTRAFWAFLAAGWLASSWLRKPATADPAHPVAAPKTEATR